MWEAGAKHREGCCSYGVYGISCVVRSSLFSVGIDSEMVHRVSRTVSRLFPCFGENNFISTNNLIPRQCPPRFAALAGLNAHACQVDPSPYSHPEHRMPQVLYVAPRIWDRKSCICGQGE